MEKIHKIKSWEELRKLLGDNEKRERKCAFAIVGCVFQRGENPDTFYIAEINTLDTTPIINKLNQLTDEMGVWGKTK